MQACTTAECQSILTNTRFNILRLLIRASTRCPSKSLLSPRSAPISACSRTRTTWSRRASWSPTELLSRRRRRRWRYCGMRKRPWLSALRRVRRRRSLAKKQTGMRSLQKSTRFPSSAQLPREAATNTARETMAIRASTRDRRSATATFLSAIRRARA